MGVRALVEDVSAQSEKSAENGLSDSIVRTEEPSSSVSNDDLEVLESSLIEMERYVEELQFEVLKLRQEDEAKQLKTGRPPIPFAEVLSDLERMLASLEAHKKDYNVMVEIQAENIRLQEEVTQLTEEARFLRRELETMKRAHANQLEAISLANEEKLTAMRNEYEAKLTKQSNQFTEMIDNEQANFAAQRDAWNEERASLLINHANELASVVKLKDQKVTEEEPDFGAEILRQINEVQYQVRQQAAQLQSRLERLLTASTMVKTSTRTRQERARGSSFKTSIAISTPPPQLQWPQQQEAENVPQRPTRKPSAPSSHQADGSSGSLPAQVREGFTNTKSGQKRGHSEPVLFIPPKPPIGTAAQLPARKSLKVATVPPVLVMAEEPHPLLEAPENFKEKESGCLELPHSKWDKATDLLNQRSLNSPFFQLPSAGSPNVNLMTPNDWFDFGDEQFQNGIQNQVENVRQAFSSPLPSISPLVQHQPVGFSGKRRHLFTVHSASYYLTELTLFSGRKRRQAQRSPYFSVSLDSDDISTSGDEFIHFPRLRFTPRPKSASRSRSRRKTRDGVTESLVVTELVGKPNRRSKKMKGKVLEEAVKLEELPTHSEASDIDGWEEVSNLSFELETKQTPSTHREIEFFSQLLQRSENEVTEIEEQGCLEISVSTLPRKKPSSRGSESLAALTLAKEIRERTRDLHMFYVLEFLTFGRFANKACDDATVRALALSLIDAPKSWNLEALRSLVLTFASLNHNGPKIKNPNICEAIQTRLQCGSTSIVDCTLLMVAALRACGLDTRLVLAFAPPSLKPCKGNAPLSLKKLKPLKSSSLTSKIISSESEDDKKNLSLKYTFFGEVYLPSDEVWYSINLLSPMGYLGRTPIDLAPRYDPAWMSTSRGHRIPDSQWKKLLATLRGHCDGDVTNLRTKDIGGMEEMRDAADVERIFDHLRSLPLPVKVQDFKGHPLYALRRHLLKFEVIYPLDAPVVGFLKVGGKASEAMEPIYPRECVHTCHTRESWLKEAKTIRLGEKAAKEVKAMMSMKRKLLQESNGPPPMVELFGPWQVEDYVPPVAENGIVPRNEHGNVELFKPCMLPIGCVHVRLAGIQHIAKRLEIDVVPAMVGWSFHKAGWAHPEYDGFVVCREVLPVLVDAWRAERMSAAAAAAVDRNERALANWKRLTRNLLLWHRIEAGFQLAKATVNATTPPASTGEGEKLSLSKTSTSDSPWQSLATASPIFPRLLDASDLVKAEPNLRAKSKPKRVAKKPPQKKRRRRRQLSTSEEEEVEDGFTLHDSE
ncbi:hypothetical protein TcWFU_002808 [Taenia crassiceps]|uniref:Uncharacterized protein n=1 Tax=Taenia crassiceps TaxID=6207 RepID=A0ABR4Q977_9CEST